MDSKEQTMLKMVGSATLKMYDALIECIANLNGTPEEKDKSACAFGITASKNLLMASISILEAETSASYATQILDLIIADLKIQKRQLQDEGKTEHE